MASVNVLDQRREFPFSAQCREVRDLRLECADQVGHRIDNASRSVLYASNGDDFADAARAAAQTLRDEINRLRRASL